MHKNLSEERSRMQKLMGFIYEYNSHDVLSEEVIKKSVISEQGVKKYNMKPVDFSKSLKDNMIGVYADDAGLQESLGEWESFINQEKKKRRKLESITIDVSAGASKLAATNRLPKGESVPDHDYGGIVPKDKWTTYDQDAQLNDGAPVGKIPVGYDPNSGYYIIKGGNKFLAQNRAINLKKRLEKYFADNHPNIKPVVKMYPKLDTKKFASAEIKGVTYTTPTPEPKIPYIQQLLNMPEGMHQSKYHFVNKEGEYKNITKPWYDQVKKFMYKTSEEGGYAKNDPLYGVRELVDVGWEDWKKWKRNPELYPQFKKLKTTPTKPLK